MTKQCEVCGTENSGDARFCAGCGSQFREVVKDFDAFISYRRETGSHAATAIKALLESQYSKHIFLDVRELQTGRFDESLLSHIEKSPAFILILSRDCLGRCAEKSDWLKREVVHALDHKRKIIPVLMEGFTYPPEEQLALLPEALRVLPQLQAITYSHIHQESAIRKIAESLRRESPTLPDSGHAPQPVSRGTTGASEFTNSVGMKFVRIEPGAFKMGWAYHGSVYVRLTKAYYLQTTPVTQAQWQAVLGNNPSRFKGPGRPVDNVTWGKAQEFIRLLNMNENVSKYRLPTEAEWEWACRACGQEAPEGVRDLDEIAWWSKNSGGESHPVGQKRPNALGLFDMRGNVKEWAQDWHDDYPAEPQTGALVDPQGPATGSCRVFRGGSWKVEYDSVFECGFREFAPDLPFGIDDVGFRCAATID